MGQIRSLSVNRIAFVGGGAMAEAIIKGLIGSGLLQPSAISVGNRTQKRCDYLRSTYGVDAVTDNAAAVADADLVIFAVKPQVAPVALTPELVRCFKKGAWVLSIMGSVTIEQLHGYAPGFPVIRTMPNTPLAVGAGMTAICCDDAVTEKMRADAAAIFGCCGETEFIEESQIEAVTALSGCAFRLRLRDYRRPCGRRRACWSATRSFHQAGSADLGRQRQAVYRKRSASGTAARPGYFARWNDHRRYPCVGEPWCARCFL